MIQRKDLFDRIFLFACGLFSHLHLQVIGFIPITEFIIAFSAFFVTVRNYPVYGRPVIKILLGLLLAWLLSAIVSDLVRGSVSAQFLRGWSRVIFFGLAIVTLYPFLARNPGNIRWFLLGAVPSAFISMFAFKGGVHEVVEMVYGLNRTWQHYFTVPYFILTLTVSAWLYKYVPKVTLLLILLAGAVNIFFGSRSGGAVMILGGLMGMFFHFQALRHPNRRLKLTFPKLVGFAATVFLGGWLILEGYGFSATRGWLGEEARAKFEVQAQSRLGLVLGGRLNVVAGVLAVYDSPIIGYGSWPEDRFGYWIRAQELGGEKITESPLAHLGFPRIPTHSYLLEGWVEHGLAGGVFWIFVIGVLIRFVIRSIFLHPDLIALHCLLLAWFGWNILFSPLGNRPTIAAFLLLFVAISDWHLTAKRGVLQRPGQRSRNPRFGPRHLPQRQEENQRHQPVADQRIQAAPSPQLEGSR